MPGFNPTASNSSAVPHVWRRQKTLAFGTDLTYRCRAVPWKTV